MHRLRDLHEWPTRHPHLLDAGLAVLAWVVLGLSVVLSRMVDGPLREALLFAVISAQTLPLALRRRRPVLTFTVVSLACLSQLFVVQEALPSDIGFLVALYALAAYADDPRWRRAGLGVAVLAGPLATWSWSRGAPLSAPGFVIGAGFMVGVGVVTWVYGDLVRKRRAVVARLEEQNAALRRERDQRAELAAQHERTRIAREMHDVVAHGLSVIVVQADGGAYAAEHAPQWSRDDGRHTLQTIATTAREALSETRHLVGVLREPGSAATADLAPAASLDDLEELMARVRGSGTEVHLSTTGDLAGLPREVGLAAYRVVQESLTNVLKHAGPHARAWVDVERAAALRVEVRDDGRGAAAVAGDGNGLIGMRERALAVGGELWHGPLPGGGWAVRAELPVGGHA